MKIIRTNKDSVTGVNPGDVVFIKNTGTLAGISDRTRYDYRLLVLSIDISTQKLICDVWSTRYDYCFSPTFTYNRAEWGSDSIHYLYKSNRVLITTNRT